MSVLIPLISASEYPAHCAHYFCTMSIVWYCNSSYTVGIQSGHTSTLGGTETTVILNIKSLLHQNTLILLFKGIIDEARSVTPLNFSASIGLGIFCGILPIWGVQSILAFALASMFKLSRTVTFISSNLPLVLFPLIIYLSLLTGHFMISGDWDLVLPSSEHAEDWKRKFALEYVLGSIVFSLIAGGVFAVVAYIGVRLIQVCRPSE